MKRIQYISVLNVVACMSVVFLHVNGCFWNFSYEKYWVEANIIESVFYFAVPIFFMITGATLMNYRKRYSTMEFLKKRFAKTVIPFIAWSILGVIYVFEKAPASLEGATIASLISGIMGNRYISIYWFFAPLFSVYLSIPVLSLIPEESRKEAFLYLTVAIFVTSSLAPFIAKLLGINYNTNLNIAVGGGYILYVALGYLISNYEISKKSRCIIYVLGISGLVAHIFGTWYLSYEAGKIVSTFKGYTNVPCILYSTAIFVFFRYTDFSKAGKGIMKVVDFISQYTFAVYLMHYYVIDIFRRICMPDITGIKYRMIFPYCVMAICILLSIPARKLPFIRKLIP